MKFLIYLFVFFCAAQNSFADQLEGNWFFYKKIYDGNEILETPEATLRLNFAFDGNGSDHLYWSHTDQAGACSRIGNYTYDGKVLHDAIVWVDPKNLGDCANDPDMQLGRITDSPLLIVNGELQLSLAIGDDVLIYVFSKENFFNVRQ